MAFDHNYVAKDLKPINVARTVSEEARIAVATPPAIATTTTAANTARHSESLANRDGSIPVYYPAPSSEAGFVGLGYLNPGMAPWAPLVPFPVGSVNLGVNGPAAVGFGYNPSLGNRLVSNAVDQAGNDMVTGLGGLINTNHLANRVSSNGSSELTGPAYGYNPHSGSHGSGNSAFDRASGSEEGGDDSVSGKKVKFMCSFGGQILPRPSDGSLRYVGGHTRIISVRRGVSFNELVQKMFDIYGQPAVIKYQLPDEDLDALVSVSCADDLDNMMDEYEKLVERSSDGSARLRVFLFSATELDSSALLQFVDIHDSGQRYVNAINGMEGMEGVGGRIARKESIASATSTQNSDFSGTEAVDSSGYAQVEVSGTPTAGMLSRTVNPTTVLANNTEQPNPPVYLDGSIPMVNSCLPQTLSPQPEVEFERHVPVSVPQQQPVGYDFQQAGMGFSSPAPHLQAYVDPRTELSSMHLPTQTGYPAAQMRFAQQQIPDNSSGLASPQFIHHVAVRPTMVQTVMQPQQCHLEHYSDENAFNTRIVQFPLDPGYSAYHQAQVPTAIIGGGYSQPVPRTEHVVFSDGSMPHQQVIFPEKIQTLEDCFMCQKALPHGHSDSLVQDQRERVASPLSDSNSVHLSLHLGDATKVQPIHQGMVGGTLGDGIVEQAVGAQSCAPSQLDHQAGLQPSEMIETPHENERIAIQQTNSNQPMISVAHEMIVVPGFTSAIPQPHPEDSRQQHPVLGQCQVNEEALLKKPINGAVTQTTESDYFGKLPCNVSKENIADVYNDQLRPIEGTLEGLRICPPGLNANIDQSKSLINHIALQVTERDIILDNTHNKSRVVLDSNHIKQPEVLAACTEVPYLYNSRPMESYEATQPSIFDNQVSYSQPKIGVDLLDSSEVSHVNPTFLGAESLYALDKLAEWQNETSQLLMKRQADVGAASNANIQCSISPSARVVDIQDSPNSLFSSKDPWNLRHDAHLPPQPNKILARKENFDTKDPFNENYSSNAGEVMGGRLFGDGILQTVSNSDRDFNSEQDQSFQGSAEELIKQELQVVAEDVVASVFESTNLSPSPLIEKNESAYAGQENDLSIKDVEMHQKTKLEDMKKQREKMNIRFPVSEGIGRLQIIKNSDLEELQELGSGTFGTVYHGKWRGSDVAIKRINDRCFAGKPSEQDRMIEDFWNEAIKLADLHHPNVVAFYGVVLDGPGGSVATVTEYMVNGSLRNALQKNERSLDKRKRLLIAMDVAFGMEYLHGKNIVHFDLKSDNLLVNLRDPHRPICKVGDLGLSKVKCQTLISGGVRGTLPWMAPELLNGSSSLVSEKVDVFSFGIVLWELLTGEEPYADLHYGAIIGGIVSNTLRPPVPEGCDLEWRSLMESCWSAEPSERPNFAEIANELRIMATKIPPKGQNPAQPQVQS